jgi:hypothetical protein
LRDDFFEELLEPFFVDVAEGLPEVLVGVLLPDAELGWEVFAAGVPPADFFAAVGLLAVLLAEVFLCDVLGVLELLEVPLV